MTEQDIELTRRKLLGAASAVGVAGAGAGMSTSAFFSDEESFEDNAVEAGELDLTVDYVTTVSQAGADTGSTTENGTIQGGESGQYVIADLKPGDEGFLAFCPTIVDNPGWLFVGSRGVTDYENGQTEPEAAVDPSGGGSLDGDDDGEGAGELSGAIEVAVSFCEPTVADPSGPDDFETIRELDNPPGYTLGDLFKELESGFLLDGDPGAEGTQAYPSSESADEQVGPCLCIEWALPASVGNEVQSDAVAFDVTFAARQERHNETPANPFADVTVAPGGDSLQAVIDAEAASGDVVSVHGGLGGGVAFEGSLVVDESITLARAGAARPTVVGPGGNSAAISIEADGVTLDGFDVTNPDGLLGVKVGDGYDDVRVCNNRIHDVGPTGQLGVTGIAVGQGDHDGVRIVGNVIEDLFQDDDGSFATLNGILFDADNDAPSTISDVTVARNAIRALESTTAPLGVVVQHDVEALRIATNLFSGLTADNSLGSGSSTTFAQGISIDSTSTSGFDVLGNTIETVESEDGFFAEAIKIEPSADVSGIDVSGNDLRVAIGLNNGDGANPVVTAENNYWGASSGPLEIATNDDDGDVPTGNGDVDLDTVTESAVTENVDYEPFASSPP